MAKSAIGVFCADRPTGRLDRSDLEEDSFLFTYREGCRPERAVSLTMPVRADQYDSMGGLLPIFEMNLPEGALKERLRLQFAKAIADFDDLDMLAIVGASQIGRLRYSQQEQLTEDVPAQSIAEILTYKGTEDLFAYLLERFAVHSGISGVQPKVLVREEKPLQKLTHRGATHIVKAFDSAEYPQLAANEWICTRGAAAAGIRTAKVRLSQNCKLLVVDRFDLTAQGKYLGSEDFCVLDGRRAHGRYNGSYENIAQRITDFVSTRALSEAREQFALMVAYSCAIENGDAHLKDFSVLYDHAESEVTLAPAYDLLSTTPYIRRDTLALTLGGSKRFPEREPLLRFIRQVTRKSERAAISLLEQVVHGVHVAIKEATSYARNGKTEKTFAERLTAVLHRGVERVTPRPKVPAPSSSVPRAKPKLPKRA